MRDVITSGCVLPSKLCTQSAYKLIDSPRFRNSTVPDQAGGVTWAVINRLFIIAQVTILVVSELGWFARLFDKFFPVVGPEFGPGPLGVFQCLIGGTVLSHHVRKFTLVSGFFLFSIGCLNIVIGLVLGVAAKTIRSGGMGKSDSLHLRRPVPLRRQSFVLSEEAVAGPSSPPAPGFGKRIEKSASIQGTVSLHNRLSFDQSLTYRLPPGIRLPQSPPPLPTYSPPRPPMLMSPNIPSTS